MALPTEIAEGVALFNDGKYFEAHERWEDHWGKGDADERDATLGLIKAAVALHHLDARNAAGFAWQAAEAVRHLRACGHVWPELHLAAFAETLDALAAEVRFHGRVAQPWTPPRLGS